MKRRIKFRGKRKDTGEWIYGYLIIDHEMKKYFIVEDPDVEYDYPNEYVCWKIYSLNSELIEVALETIGEFTDKYDKNNKEIYEGDIVKAKIYIRTSWENEIIGIVKFKDSAFVLETKNGYFYLNNVNELEVIGNIYENNKNTY